MIGDTEKCPLSVLSGLILEKLYVGFSLGQTKLPVMYGCRCKVGVRRTEFHCICYSFKLATH